MIDSRARGITSPAEGLESIMAETLKSRISISVLCIDCSAGVYLARCRGPAGVLGGKTGIDYRRCRILVNLRTRPSYIVLP